MIMECVIVFINVLFSADFSIEQNHGIGSLLKIQNAWQNSNVWKSSILICKKEVLEIEPPEYARVFLGKMFVLKMV